MKQLYSDMQLGMLCTIYWKRKKKRSEKNSSVVPKQLLKERQQYNEDPGTAEEWTDLVDRGRLWHVRETTFQVFCALEEETRPHVDKSNGPNASVIQRFHCIQESGQFKCTHMERQRRQKYKAQIKRYTLRVVFFRELKRLRKCSLKRSRKRLLKRSHRSLKQMFT